MPPEWLADAVVYEIFVDRFARHGTRADQRSAGEASTPAVGASGFMGGDLAGITDRLDDLAAMGVNVLYLTPIFLASSNHRYNTYDYYTIDPRIGTLDDFHRLVRELHRRGMRILLDGVFNHCGRGFFPFFDVMENGAASAWADWFEVTRHPVDAYGQHGFRGWLGSAEVPEVDLSHPEARAYMLRVAEYWTTRGIDGWRLDAVAHVRYRAFWRELRDVVRRVNPEAYLLAEIWEDPRPWLCGDLDGATNYAFRDAVVEFLCARSLVPSSFAERLEQSLDRRRPGAMHGMCNLLGSHDTPRLWTVAGGDPAIVRMALTILFAFPGTPCLYYGDEAGLDGALESEDRRVMEWDRDRWRADLRPFIKGLADLKRSTPALRAGDWQTLGADDERGWCAFRRTAGDSQCTITVDLPLREARLAIAHRGREVTRLCSNDHRVTGGGATPATIRRQ